MQRSDETGDGPGSLGPAVAPAADAAANNLPTQVLRERIRRAGATAVELELGAVELAPELATRSSMPPEHSGVRARPNEPIATATLPPPVFVSPPTAAGKSTPPRSWPFDPKNKPSGRRALASTQVGLGGPINAALRPAPAPLGAGRSSDKVRSHTPPLPAPLFFTASEASARPREPASDATDSAPAQPEQSVTRSGSQRTAADGRTFNNHSPGAYSVTQPVATNAAAWSPSSTKPQRAASLRQSEARSGAGRYSVQDLSVEHLDQSSRQSAHSSDPALGAGNDASDDSSARARRFTPKQRPAHRRGRDPNRITGPGRLRDERPEIMQTLPDRPAIPSVVPGRPTTAATAATATAAKTASAAKTATAATAATAATTARGGAAPAGGKGSLQNLPTLPTPGRTARGQAGSASSYEPLPRDRAGFEAFMAERAKSGAPGARLNWKEQETLLLPRSALPGVSDEPRGLAEKIHWKSVGAVLALLLIGAITFWFRTQVSETSGVRAVQISATPSPIQSPTASTQDLMIARTIIATEPSGAELLLAGAVLGNTPVEVARPEQGEETYLLRMRGFESQLVRVTPQTSEAMRITLLPLGGDAPLLLPVSNRP